MIWFCYLLFSVASAFGLSIALVKKGDEWPVVIYTNFLKKYFLPLFHRNMPQMLDCVICTSFWATLITDLCVYIFISHSYFAFPLSGFITLGIMWVVIDFLDSFNNLGDKK